MSRGGRYKQISSPTNVFNQAKGFGGLGFPESQMRTHNKRQTYRSSLLCGGGLLLEPKFSRAGRYF